MTDRIVTLYLEGFMPGTKRPNSELSLVDTQDKNKSIKTGSGVVAHPEEKVSLSDQIFVIDDYFETVKLDSILKEISVSYPKGIPQLLEAIPLKEYWRFFLDGKHQKDGQTWVNYNNREAGFLTAMSAGFVKVHEQLNSKTELTLEFIKTLHFLAVSGVRGTNYEHLQALDRREFDNSLGLGVRISDIKYYCLQGLQEIVTRIAKGNPVLQIRYGFFSDQILNVKNIKTFSDLPQLSAGIFNSGGCFTGSSVGEKNNIILHRETAERHFQKMIKDYLISIKVITQPIDKIKRIVEFVTECEQSHPYLDGNCRTFCVLMLNYLLMQNNFPPVIMDDPNKFDMCDVNTLVETVISGMQATLSLLKHKELYGEKTDEILKGHNDASRKIFNESYEVLKKHFQPSILPVVTPAVPVMTRANLQALGISSRKFFIPKYKEKVRAAFGIDEKDYAKVMQPFK
jgi:hypothetical protein